MFLPQVFVPYTRVSVYFPRLVLLSTAKLTRELLDNIWLPTTQSERAVLGLGLYLKFVGCTNELFTCGEFYQHSISTYHNIHVS